MATPGCWRWKRWLSVAGGSRDGGRLQRAEVVSLVEDHSAPFILATQRRKRTDEGLNKIWDTFVCRWLIPEAFQNPSESWLASLRESWLASGERVMMALRHRRPANSRSCVNRQYCSRSNSVTVLNLCVRGCIDYKAGESDNLLSSDACTMHIL